MKSTTFIAFLLAGSAFAWEAPKPECAQPNNPGRMASDSQKKVFAKRFKEYGDCMKQYIEQMGNTAKAANEAGNAAVNEYNDFAKKINEENGQ